MRLKIALLVTDIGHGGVVNLVWELARGLKEKGHEVTVISSGGARADELRSLDIAHYSVPFNSGLKAFITAREKLKLIFKKINPDIIHSHNRYPSIICMSIGLRPDVSTAHSECLTAHGSILDFGLIRKSITVWGEIVIAISTEVRQNLIKEFNLLPQRVVVVSNGVDAAKFYQPTKEQKIEARRKLGLLESDRVALFVGQIEKRKRVDLCIKGLDYAVRNGAIDAKLIIAGDGERLEEVKLMAIQRNVAERCLFVGWVRDVISMYHASDLLILPSKTEGFGLVCAEAMMCGLPVLRTRSAGYSQQIMENKTGWSVEVGNERELFEKLNRALVDSILAKKCGLLARKHALANFSKGRFIESVIDIYERGYHHSKAR